MKRRSGTETATRLHVHRTNGVGAITGALWPLACGSAAQVRSQGSARRWHGGTAGLILLQGPLLYSAIDLPQVIDAGIPLRGGAGIDEVRNRDGSQEANN